MESHEEWRDLKEEEIKIRRRDRSENVDHNSNCHLFTSLNCSKSYSNYQMKIVNAATMNDFNICGIFLWNLNLKYLQWDLNMVQTTYQTLISNINMKYQATG